MTARKGRGSSSAADELEAVEAAEVKATLDEALAELGGDALEVVLFKQDPQAPTSWAYVGGFPAGDFSLEAVKQQHGGGNYRARILGSNKKFRRQVTFQIDRSFKPPALPAAPTAPPPVAPEMLAVLEAIKGQTEAIRTLAVELRSGGRPQTDPLEYGLKIAALVTQSGGNGKGQGLGVSDILDLLDRGMELAGNTNGDNGGYKSVIDGFGKPLLELLQKAMDRPTDPRRFKRNMPPPENPNGGVPETAAPIAVAIQAPPPTAPPWLAHLAPLVPHGLRMAALGLEAESFAPALYQLIPESDLDALELAAADPTFSITVLEAYPETMQQYRDWFTRLLEAVRELILEGGKAEVAEGTAE